MYGEKYLFTDAIKVFIIHNMALLLDMILIFGISLYMHGLKILIKSFAKAMYPGTKKKLVFINLIKPLKSVLKRIIDYLIIMNCDKWIKYLYYDKLNSWQIQQKLDFKTKKIKTHQPYQIKQDYSKR